MDYNAKDLQLRLASLGNGIFILTQQSCYKHLQGRIFSLMFVHSTSIKCGRPTVYLLSQSEFRAVMHAWPMLVC